MEKSEIPRGYCRCGCGEKTNIALQDDPKGRFKKGEPKMYLNHHKDNKKHLIPKICKICGVEFLPNGKSRQQSQLTCSARCRNTHNSLKTVDQRSEKLRGRGEGKSYPKIDGRHAHRVVMEQILGRPLAPGEVVHHIDGNRLNRDPSNLELLSGQAEHASLHSTKGRVCSVDGCDRKHKSLGCCTLHYQRFKRLGTTELKRGEEDAQVLREPTASYKDGAYKQDINHNRTTRFRQVLYPTGHHRDIRKTVSK